MKQIDEMNYLSDEGKVFVQKETGIIYGWGISLGLEDSIDNYEEVDCTICGCIHLCLYCKCTRDQRCGC